MSQRGPAFAPHLKHLVPQRTLCRGSHCPGRPRRQVAGLSFLGLAPPGAPLGVQRPQGPASKLQPEKLAPTWRPPCPVSAPHLPELGTNSASEAQPSCAPLSALPAPKGAQAPRSWLPRGGPLDRPNWGLLPSDHLRPRGAGGSGERAPGAQANSATSSAKAAKPPPKRREWGARFSWQRWGRRLKCVFSPSRSAHRPADLKLK